MKQRKIETERKQTKREKKKKEEMCWTKTWTLAKREEVQISQQCRVEFEECTIELRIGITLKKQGKKEKQKK